MTFPAKRDLAKDLAIALILAVATMILCYAKVIDGWHFWSDDSAYIAQAIALAQGKSADYINDNTFMMTKSDWLIGPNAYPWGFPALLAIAYKVFGPNIIALKMVNILCYGLFVGIFYMFCATQIRRIYAIFATLFFALNPYMTYFVANDMLSDVCFLLFCFCAIIILAKLFGGSKNPHSFANVEQNAESKIDSSLRENERSEFSWQSTINSNSCEAPKSRPLRGAKNRIEGRSSASADFLLEAEKRGSPPKSEKAAAFWRVGGAGRGVQPFLREEISELRGQSGENLVDSANQTKIAESYTESQNLKMDCHDSAIAESRNDRKNTESNQKKTIIAESMRDSQNLNADSAKIKNTHPLHHPSAREGESLCESSAREGEIEKAPPLAGGVWGGVFSAREWESSGIFIAIFGGVFMLFSVTIRINGFVILCALVAMHGILLTKHFAPHIFKLRAFRLLNHINSPYSWQIHAIPYAIFALGFMLISLILSSGTSGHFGELAHISIPRIAQNLLSYSLRFNQFFDLGAFDFAILALCLLPFLLRGIFDKFAESALDSAISSSAFFLIFCFGYFALLLLWMETFGVRFVLPLVPFLLFWTFSGIAKSRKFYRFAISVILLLILGSFLHLNYLDISLKNAVGRTSNINAGTYSKESLEVFEIIKQKIPQNAIIISLKPRALYLNTRRIGFATGDAKRLSEADFVLWSAEYKQLNIFNADFQSKTTLIFENSEWKLFKVLK